jgi:fructose-1,6-bisphosphatase/inositol monophosphatase family enzyme
MNDDLSGDHWAAILMLDVQGYSSLPDWSFDRFLGKPLTRINASLQKAKYKNTWGDGVIAVFTEKIAWESNRLHGRKDKSPQHAAAAALEVLSYVDNGLKADLNLQVGQPKVRIALHYGKVTFGKDAVREAANGLGCCGEAINTCARIEPVVRGNDALCTEEFFKALSFTCDQKSDQFACEELGKVPLAKRAGKRKLYRLVPRAKKEVGDILLGPYPGHYLIPKGTALRAEFEKKLGDQVPLHGEVFAIELLTEPITLSRTGDHTTVTVDLRPEALDDRVIISNAGKEAVFDEFVPTIKREIETWTTNDRDIQAHLVGGAGEMRIKPPRCDSKPDPRLRWASGGVLSVVTIRQPDGSEGKWIPLFFRDIRPYGWNIALGSSERRFGPDGRTVGEIKWEWEHPLQFGLREFLEETLIVRGNPELEPTGELHYRPILNVHGVLPDNWPEPAPHSVYEEKHCLLRKEEGLDLSRDDEGGLRCTLSPGNATVVLRTREDPTGKRHTTKDVLVCFSLLDLGVEIVAIVEYTLEPTDYMLDGEIRIAYGHPDEGDELVRQPIALFSYSYLQEIFGTESADWHHFTPGTAPSIVVKRPPRTDEVRLFGWDIEKRMEVVRGDAQNPTEWQRERFLDWYDRFGANFVDDSGKPTATHLPQLFVPATAKILHQYFNLPKVRAAAEESASWEGRLESLGFAIRTHLEQVIRSGADLRSPVAQEGGDTIFAIDRCVEPVIEREIEAWPAHCKPLLLVAEGFGGDGRQVFGPANEPIQYRLIVDPIDGTRGLMYDKRSAWFLAAVAPDRGDGTRLSEAVAAAMVELPTSKQAWGDSYTARAGAPTKGRRSRIGGGEAQPLPPRPSAATDLRDGFGQVSNFFPGTKVLAAELMERIAAEVLGASASGAVIFDDQYICSGGQMAELIAGRDRFCCDLRPLFYQILANRSGTATGLECHPYDIAALLVARQAGVVITDGFGDPLDCPLDVTTGVHWCGYANLTLAALIKPIIRTWLSEQGLGSKGNRQ